MEGSGNGASLSMGVLLGEPGGGGSFAGDNKGYEKKLWRRASLSIGVSLRNLEWSSSTGDFERWMKGVLEVECVCLSLSLSEEAQWRRPLGGGATLLGTLEDM